MNPVTKNKGNWQNLAHGKCPYDNTRMIRDGKVYGCTTCDYFITPSKLIQLLTDPKSLTWKVMSPHERGRIQRALQPNEQPA